MPAQEFLDYLKTQTFTSTIFTHTPIFSAEEADQIKHIPGDHTKNLFLRDKKKNYFLVTVQDHKRVNLRELSKLIGQGHFSFGSSEDLYEKMRVKPGSVTPFGLLHDREKEIQYILDQDILKADFVNFHPLRNDMTVHMAVSDFLEFMKKIHSQPTALHIPVL